MKKTLLVLSTLSLFTFSQAQNRIEKTGNNVNKDDTPYFTNIIGSDNTSFYTLRVDKNIAGLYQGNYSVDQISKTNLNYVKRIATASSDTRTDAAPLSFMVKDKIYLLTKFNNKQKKACEFTLDEISTNVANTSPKRRVLASYPTDEKTWYQTFFLYHISPDSSKIGIITKYIDDITFYIYDLNDFKEISNKKITVIKDKISIKDFFNMHFKIDNDGNLFFSRFDTQKFSFNQIPANDSKVITCSFNLNKSFDMGDIDYVFDSKNNQIYVHSMFYEKNTNPKIDNYSNIGIFIAKIDKNKMTASAEKYHSFSSDILNRITCDKLDKGIANWRTYNSYVIITENSEILFEAAQNSTALTNRGTNMNSMYDMSTKVSFDAYEIIVSKLNSSLDLKWMKLVPRCNTYTNITNKTESTILYKRLVSNGKVKYYFIEHPKFEDKQIDYSTVNYCEIPLIKSYPGTNVVEYSLDKDGKLEKHTIHTNKKEWLIPVFYDVNLGNDKYIVRLRDGDDEHFSIINLK